jgi:hypothetical protein
MTLWRVFRLTVVAAFLTFGFFWVRRSSVEPAQVSLYVTAVIGAVTTVYALFTYEILLQNQAMAKAAVDSTALTERSLRFSYTENLTFRTVNTKDPLFPKSSYRVTPVDNEDFRRAVDERSGEGQQGEFVFAVVRNVGRGAATDLLIEAEYRVTDSSNINKNVSVTKQAIVQILEPDCAIALCIFVSKVPTRDDKVELVWAATTSSNFYRDALKEHAQKIAVDPDSHHTECEPTCILRLK